MRLDRAMPQYAPTDLSLERVPPRECAESDRRRRDAVRAPEKDYLLTAAPIRAPDPRFHSHIRAASFRSWSPPLRTVRAIQSLSPLPLPRPSESRADEAWDACRRRECAAASR